MTPDSWLGRVNCIFRVVEFGAILLGAWIAREVGLRAALWVSVPGAATGVVPLLLGPNFAGIRSIPQEAG
ncbi:hypothetical protein BH23CHL4_BH23CHL4_07000 [soil metagenome]